METSGDPSATRARSRQLLEEHRATTGAELTANRASATPGGERPGFGKRAGDYVAQVVDDRTNNQVADALAAILEAIEAALGRLDDGTYGICPDCGEAIGEDRLQAVPWAPRCLRCQAVADRGPGLTFGRTGPG